MKISEVTAAIEKVAPLSTQMDFDNSGLLVGGDKGDCTGVLLTVDVTSGALATAEKEGCNLIISHHPIIFNAMKAFSADDYKADIITRAYQKGIALYAAHTNVDKMRGNMSFRLLEKLGAENIDAFCDGLGAIGYVAETTAAEIEKKVKIILDDDRTFIVGDENKKVRTIAEINGAGADEYALSLARVLGVDLFISADLHHHIMLEAQETGLTLMSIGHYASEKSFNDIVYDIIHCYSDTLKIVKYYAGNPYNGFPQR